jgi:hypothetical protein
MTKPRKQKARPARTPQYVMRVNILLTQEQFVKLQDWARDEGRPLPNLIRRLIDVGIAQRK